MDQITADRMNHDSIAHEEEVKKEKARHRYKFMVNIILQAKHRTKYMKSLEKITPDPSVPFDRLLISIGLIITVLIVYTGIIFSTNTIRTKYVGIPATLIVISLVVCLLQFLISSRDKPMIVSSSLLILTSVAEKFRRKGGRRSDVKSIGIKSVDRGVIKFTNGDVGLMYLVDGYLSPSVLPAVADQVAEARQQYFIARSPSSLEMMITSVKEVDVHQQVDTYTDLMNRATGDQQTKMWKRYMLDIQRRYVGSALANSEYAIAQTYIIRETNMQRLHRAKVLFEQSCMNGLMSSFIQLTRRSQIVEYLGPLALLSKKGMKHFGEASKKEQYFQKH